MPKITLDLPDVIEVSLPKFDGTVPVKMGKVNQETLLRTIRFALKEWFNNACGSKGMTQADCMTVCQGIAERFGNNDMSARGGGKHLSPFEHELRAVAESVLRTVCSRRGADAKVTDVGKALHDVATVLVARKLGDPNLVTKDQVDKVVEPLRKSWNDEARKNLEKAQKAVSSIDLDALLAS